MNKQASKHPQVSILEIQCPRCGEIYYITQSNGDDLEESGDTYECTSCDFEAELSDWALQEFTRGRLDFESGGLVLEDEDW